MLDGIMTNMKANFYFTKYITPILLGFLLGASILLLVAYSRDSLQRYFPDSTLAYLNIKDGQKVAELKIFRYAAEAFGVRSQIEEIASTALNERGSRFSLGLLSIHPEVKWLAAIALDKNASTQGLIDFASRNQLSSFQIIKQYNGEQIVFIGNSSAVIEEIRNQVNRSNSQVLKLGSIAQFKKILPLSRDGNLMINIDSLKNEELLPSQIRTQLKLSAAHSVDFDLIVNNGNLILSNSPLLPESEAVLDYPQEIVNGFKINQSGQDGVLFKELVKSGYYEVTIPGLGKILDINGNQQLPKTISLVIYDQLKSWQEKFSWQSARGFDGEEFKPEPAKLSLMAEKAVEKIIDFLTSKNQITRTVVLPDYSTIKEIVRDKESVEILTVDGGTQVKDLANGDLYTVKSMDFGIEISKNFKAIQPTVISGCKATSEDGYWVFDLQKTLIPNFSYNLGKLLILEHSGISSTSYPQFSFCFF